MIQVQDCSKNIVVRELRPDCSESLEILRQNDIHQYLLEVIQTNRGAVELYRKEGFKVTREFDCYILAKNRRVQLC